VARMSTGVLAKEDVGGIRSGEVADPTVSQVAALAAVFGVPASYLVDRKGAPPLDAEIIEGLGDETTREITRGALRLPEREKRIVLGIVREFGDQGPPPSG
jgi:transcriptional regulator with XRE-family HTH domain